MNEIIAGIYGTHGIEKTASAGDESIATLSDLALALVAEEAPEGTDLEKVASAHDGLLEELSNFDLSGRAAAHAQFSEMEKMASEGDWSALEAFFEEEVSEGDEIKSAVLAELERRA